MNGIIFVKGKVVYSAAYWISPGPD
jgi:hypothetical protein